jgi:hypothetical protein
MPTDEELEKELDWSYNELRGDARASAAAGLAILRAIRRFDKGSSRLGWAMGVMTLVLIVLTILLVVLTVKMLPR